MMQGLTFRDLLRWGRLWKGLGYSVRDRMMYLDGMLRADAISRKRNKERINDNRKTPN